MRKSILAIAIAAMTFSLAACGQKADNNDANNNTNNEATVRTATDVSNHTVEVPVQPERVVDLSGASDTLSVLGFNVVGTCNSDAYDYTKLPTYLEETLKDATILGYSMLDTVDVEAIIGLEPDLIVISKVQEKSYDQLSKIAPTLVVDLKQVDFKEDFLSVAKIMDREDEANEWLAAYDEKVKEVSASMKEQLGADSTYLSFLASFGSNYVFSNSAIGSFFYDDLGLQKPANLPAQEDMTLPVVDSEGLAQIDADYMFVVATDEDRATLENDKVYQNLRAVKEGHVIMLPASPYFTQTYGPIGRVAFLDELKEFTTTLSE
ncbi:MAG: ABC transporter substrate-binding protein [bacterium]|nr:ABC transporter substrate-binding protein [bacterium]